MNAKDYWQLFLETGAPEAYLLFSLQQKVEGNYVSDHPGYCPEGHRLS